MNRRPALPRASSLALSLAAFLALPSHAGLDVAGLDKSVDPCTDFYQYANRSWMASTPIPSDRERWGVFQIIGERNEKVLAAALDEAMRKPLPPEGTTERKVVEYYASGMDTAAIEEAGLAPIRPLLEATDKVGNPRALMAAIAILHRQGIEAGFDFDVQADRKDSGRYQAMLAQGGLGLPDRDYYFLDDDRSKRLRDGYRRLMARLFELAGDSPEAAARAMEAAFSIETELARASMTATERRDVDKTYNKMTLVQLSSDAPGLPWVEYFLRLGARDVPDVNVNQPAFMKALARLAVDRPAEQWRAYLRWQVLVGSASKLPAAFREAHFDFYERQFRGVQVEPPRTRQVLLAMGGPFGSQGLGQGIGKVFVERQFSPEAKARARELIDNVKLALRGRLERVDWMSPETRQAALGKLAAMNVKIGYPDRWRDYSKADIGPYPFVQNWMNAAAFDSQRLVARIGQPVDKGDWWMSPHIVNAYYSASNNEIVFPAAILQPPYFDAQADDALNYGGIGMVIGHEITHGFDDRGRRFDKDGNLREWWTPEDARRYTERAQKVVAQYDAMPGVEGVKPNGKLTLGENLSDVGGIKIAYDALQIALAKKPQGPIEGLTPEQRFFLSFAQCWKQNSRVEWERNALLTGSHSLPRFRVQGPLAQFPEFARAFACDPGRALVSESLRANIW